MLTQKKLDQDKQAFFDKGGKVEVIEYDESAIKAEVAEKFEIDYRKLKRLKDAGENK